MTSPEKNEAKMDVPNQIFNCFLKELKEKELPDDLIDRLRKTLIEDKKFTDQSLKSAVFNDGSQT